MGLNWQLVLFQAYNKISRKNNAITSGALLAVVGGLFQPVAVGDLSSWIAQPQGHWCVR